MKRIAIFSLLLFSSVIGFAQDRPAFLPEDVETGNLEVKCLCKPGVTNQSRSRGLEISFQHAFNSSLDEEEGFPLSPPVSELTIQNLTLNLRVPIINKVGLKVIGGVFYRPEHYDVQKIGSDYQAVFNHLDGKNLKSSGFEGVLIKSWSEKFYSTLRVRTAFNGDYTGFINFSTRYAIYNATAFFGVKSRDEKEWGVGLNYTQSFRNTLVLPFLLYNQTFNDKWGIEMVLPALVVGRYNLSDKSILLLGFRYNSRSYSVELEDTTRQVYNLNHSEVCASFTLEQQLHPWIWLDITVGIQNNFSTDFEAENNPAASFQVEPGRAPFFKIGFFVSPPNSFLK